MERRGNKKQEHRNKQTKLLMQLKSLGFSQRQTGNSRTPRETVSDPPFCLHSARVKFILDVLIIHWLVAIKSLCFNKMQVSILRPRFTARETGVWESLAVSKSRKLQGQDSNRGPGTVVSFMVTPALASLGKNDVTRNF